MARSMCAVACLVTVSVSHSHAVVTGSSDLANFDSTPPCPQTLFSKPFISSCRNVSPPTRHLISCAQCGSFMKSVFLNSLLAMMNARHSLRDPNSTDPYSIPLSKASSSGRVEIKSRPQDNTEPVRSIPFPSLKSLICSSYSSLDQCIDIQIETTTDRKYDGDFVQDPPHNKIDFKVG